jgi:hypothetical protein
MNSRSASTLFAAACVAAASAAHALPLSDRASFELFAGGDVGMHGPIRDSFNSPGADGPTTFNHLGLEDMYAHSYDAGAEFDYAVDSHLQAFARGAYSKLGGADQRIGMLFSDSQGVQKIDARFGDANTKEVDLGARYLFGTGETWRPFFGAAIGETRLSGKSAMVGEPGGAPTTRVELSRPSTVFSQRLETGVQYSPMRNFDVRLTAAATHDENGRPSGDPNLAMLGLTEDNRSIVRGHWDFPAEVGAVWHF